MREEDLDGILEIERISFPTPWTREMFEQELRNGGLPYFIVAKIGGRLIGYGGFWLVASEAHIGNVAVHPDFRRRKIGEKLMERVLEMASSKGARRATLEVRASNLAAQSLYRKFGFEEVAICSGYYQDTKEDAVVMSLVMEVDERT